jgi:predicted transcriptional regulator of viral defense system
MKLKDFKKIINRPFFAVSDVVFRKANIYNYQISLWQKKGDLGRLRKGFYFFNDQKDKIKPEEIAFLIYEPSYISMEYVLSFYGIIPEIVFEITSVATRKTNKFSNDFGSFSYRTIKPELFFGYDSKQTDYGKYLIADLEKALLDYFYFNLGKIENEEDIKELRVNHEEFRKAINKKKLIKYLDEFKIKKLEKVINILLKQCLR